MDRVIELRESLPFFTKLRPSLPPPLPICFLVIYYFFLLTVDNLMKTNICI